MQKQTGPSGICHQLQWIDSPDGANTLPLKVTANKQKSSTNGMEFVSANHVSASSATGHDRRQFENTDM